MRVFVKVCSGGASGPLTYVVPCKDPTARVASLKTAAIERWLAGSKGDWSSGKDAELFRLTLSGNGAVLSDSDAIGEAVRDGEFLNLCA